MRTHVFANAHRVFVHDLELAHVVPGAVIEDKIDLSTENTQLLVHTNQSKLC